MSRLRSSSFQLSKHLASISMQPLAGSIDRLEVWSLPDMATAAATIHRRLRYWPVQGEKKSIIQSIPAKAVQGDAARLAAALEASESLVTAAIAHDPRLARRSQWLRAEEGEVVCPALLSEGDDAPCFRRARSLLATPNGSEPVRVVISTDDNSVPSGTAAAFIATVRLVQQWRPVEIWWQGSWLSLGRERGYVFHVPLVAGDMDFSRLEFCIADPRRDNLSWAVMMTHAIEVTHRSWGGDCSLQAQRSYLPGAQFVSHRGIAPEDWSVAMHAAYWLGWETAGEVRREEQKAETAALQGRREEA